MKNTRVIASTATWTTGGLLDEGLSNTAAGCHSATWQPLSHLEKKVNQSEDENFYSNDQCTPGTAKGGEGRWGKQADSDACKEGLEQRAEWFEMTSDDHSHSSCRNTQMSPQGSSIHFSLLKICIILRELHWKWHKTSIKHSKLCLM